MATKRILLTRKWSGHEAGEIIEEQDFTVDSMIRKGYGTLYRGPQPSAAQKLEVPGSPPIETAMLTPPAETATTGPQAGKHKPKNGARAAKSPDVTPQDKET